MPETAPYTPLIIRVPKAHADIVFLYPLNGVRPSSLYNEGRGFHFELGLSKGAVYCAPTKTP
jgi:hypothetical protein